MRGEVDPKPNRRRGRPARNGNKGSQRKAHEHIGIKEAQNLSLALGHARVLGFDPTLWITIQWKHAESPRDPADRLRRVLNLTGVWLRRQANLPAIWVYAREVGRLKGEHVHLALHVPDHLRTRFEKAFRGWIEMEVTGEVLSTAVDVQRIRTNDIDRTLLSYLLKEGSDEVHSAFGVHLNHRSKRTGHPVLGKRVKVSRSIDRMARSGPQMAT